MLVEKNLGRVFFLSRMDGCVCCDDVDGGIEWFRGMCFSLQKGFVWLGFWVGRCPDGEVR